MASLMDLAVSLPHHTASLTDITSTDHALCQQGNEGRCHTLWAGVSMQLLGLQLCLGEYCAVSHHIFMHCPVFAAAVQNALQITASDMWYGMTSAGTTSSGVRILNSLLHAWPAKFTVCEHAGPTF